MTLIVAFLAQAIHLGLMLLAAPSVAGVTDWLDARLAGRPGPPILLPWRDLARLSRKAPTIPESASSVLAFAPLVQLAATLTAAALVPSFTLGMAFSPLADGLVVAGLLSAARMAACLGGLDSGSAVPGLRAQQACARAVLTEPALLLFVLTLALMGGGFNLDLIIGQQRDGILLPAAASALALTSLLALAFADAADPTAGPDPDDSGTNLAIARFAGWLRRLVWIDLIGGLFLPVGMANAGSSPLDWATGMICWAAKLAAAVIGLSIVRALLGSGSPRTLPNLVGIAALLALLAAIMVLAGSATA